MIPLSVRIENFLGAVEFAADEDMQRAVWIEKAQGLTSITSVGEFFCQFFDDNDMDGFIENEMDTAAISDDRKDAIRQFRDALRGIENLQSYKNDDDESTIRSAQWTDLVRCAKRTLKCFGV